MCCDDSGCRMNHEVAGGRPSSPSPVGTVYACTVVHVAPEAWQERAPYQLVLVEWPDGSRVLGQVEGRRVSIGDRVIQSHVTGGVPYFKAIDDSCEPNP